MDPEGILVFSMVTSVLLFIFLIVRAKQKHELAKLDRTGTAGTDRSLTAGELEDMIRSVVSDATAPLQDRVDELTRRLGPGSDQSAYDEEHADASVADKTVGRRQRV